MREMPTGAKAMGAICLAALAYGAALIYLPGLSEPQQGQWFEEASAAMGAVIGWRVLGRNVGNGMTGAMRAGLYSVIWLFVVALFAFSFREMILRSLDKRYRMPTDAFNNMVEIGISYANLAASVEFIGFLVIGGMIAGLLTELAHRAWH